MKIWPDTEQKLLRSYVAQLDLADSVRARRPYESVLRRFQKYVVTHAPEKPLGLETVQSWLRERVRWHGESLQRSLRRHPN